MLAKSRHARGRSRARLGVGQVPVEQVEQRLEGLHRADRVGGRAAEPAQRPLGAVRSPKLVNRKAARPSGAVRKVALNGSAAFLSLSAVTAYP